ncbi:MAG: LysM peptidoglycan-binding domain-containing protein [Anaerolineae bacterium]
MNKLCGKGIWLAHSYDLQRAVEMATKMEANHLLVKVGHGPLYFPEIARQLLDRVHTLGFRALAWVHITDRAPQDAFYAVRRAVELGYRSVVLFLGQALLTRDQVQPLADALASSGMPLTPILLATPPLPYLPDRRTLEVLAPLCQGGWMPLCFPRWNSDAASMIHRDVYQAVSELTLLWQKTPAIYPVLAPTYGEQARETFLPEHLIPWVENLVEHGVDAFSVYHAAITEKACWPILQAAGISCEEEEVPLSSAEGHPTSTTTIPQPEYVTVTANDTLWGVINRYGMTKEQFWKWNGHLWDSRGLPRDPDYMRAGWRLRVK